MVFVLVVFSSNIIRIVLENIPLGMPQALLVRDDLCGPLSSPSFSRCKYFLTFIDDFSRHNWVYFLKIKSKFFDKFFSYKALIEKKYEHQIQRLRTDNGGEYVNNNFTSHNTHMASKCNTLFHIHHNKMVLLRERTAH